ncbi:Pcl6 protein [Saccharomycopsis crataegensis]|uniref:Pcl6 protein n=1 Tax=Saccharomycopsis crataegensis TaxID=43959 RepID=A0AAV5QDW3_9ASCO|nr:Pcl6 protein [Saccharomycopsis crataegensis]
MVYPIGIPGHQNGASVNNTAGGSSYDVNNPQNSLTQNGALPVNTNTPSSSYLPQGADLSQYAASSIGSNSNFTFNNSNTMGNTESPLPNPSESHYRRYSNNSVSDRSEFINPGPRASLLTSKLAKVQKSLNSSPKEKLQQIDDSKSNFPYPNPRDRGLGHRTYSNSNMRAVPPPSNQKFPVVDNSTSSLSSSFKYSIKQDQLNNYNAAASSYSSAPVSLGKTNHFIPVSSEPKSFNNFHPHSIAAPGMQSGSFNFHFPQPAPAITTTNISMETASSNIQNNNINSNNGSANVNPQTHTHHHNHHHHHQLSESNEPFNAAKEIYDPIIPHQSQNGIIIDSRGEEHLNIVDYPSQELLLMLASLLQKIIDANDTLHPNHYNQASQLHETNKFTANVLAFHGTNVPAIPIYNYFLRILKYCPMTNEVFLSLLVYFDRIAKLANINSSNDDCNSQSSLSATSPGSLGGFKRHTSQSQLFVMDSFNIHRLIIAGITVSSKFFSDVFYKNARYARVGGLPLDELNHIELQFILLTDFKLLIQPDELQRYADLLLKFWKREKAKTNNNNNGPHNTNPNNTATNNPTVQPSHPVDTEMTDQ